MLYNLLDPDKSPADIQLVLEQYVGAENELYTALLQRFHAKKADPENGEKAEKEEKKHSPPAPPASPGAPAAASPRPPPEPQLLPEPRIRVPGAVRALIVGVDTGPGKACVKRARDVEDWIGPLLRPQIHILNSERPDCLVTSSNILSGLRWLSEGSREGDLLFFSYCGDGAGGALSLSDGTRITSADAAAALLKRLPSGVRVVMLVDTYPAGSFISLPYRLTETEKDQGLPGEKSEADVVVFSAAGGSYSEAGALTNAFLRVVKTTFQPSYRYLLSEIAKELRQLHGTGAPVPQVQSTRPLRHSAAFGVQGLDDMSPPSPEPQIADAQAQAQAATTPKVGLEPSGGDLANIVSMTFQQADDPTHPNHATAAGTVGAWLMDGTFGVEKNEVEALRYLSIAAGAGDGPSVSRLGRLQPSPASPFAAVPPFFSSPHTTGGTSVAPLDSEEVSHIRSSLAAFCAARAPHALANIHSIIEEYKGREAVLLKLLRQRYPEWPWPSQEQDGLQPGCAVEILDDVPKVKEAAAAAVSVNWDDTMESYCGTLGTVLAADAAKNVKVSFSDGRACWWPAAVVRPVGLPGVASILTVVPEQEQQPASSAVKDEKTSPVVRIFLLRPSEDPSASLAAAAPFLDIEESSLELLPITIDDGPVLRVRIKGVVAAERVAREMAARCRIPEDPLCAAVGAVGAELEASGGWPGTPATQQIDRLSSFLASQAIATPPPPLMPLAQAASAPFPRRHQPSFPSSRSFFEEASPYPQSYSPSAAAITLGTPQRQSLPSHTSRTRQETPRARAARKGLTSLRKKLYGDTHHPTSATDAEESEEEPTKAVVVPPSLLQDPPAGVPVDEWAVMTEQEKQKEEERERARKKFNERRNHGTMTPVSGRQVTLRTVSPPRPTSQPTSPASPLNLQQAAHEVLNILDNSSEPPQPVKSYVSVATRRNLHHLMRKEAQRSKGDR